MSSGEGKRSSGEGKTPWTCLVALIGVLAGIISIVTFLTGKGSLPDLFGSNQSGADKTGYDPSKEIMLTDKRSAALFDNDLIISVEEARYGVVVFSVSEKGENPIRKTNAKVGDAVNGKRYEVKFSSLGLGDFFTGQNPPVGFIVTKLP